MTKFFTAFFVLLLFASSTFATPTRKLYCVSWMNKTVEINSVPLTEYETAHLRFEIQGWAYEADVMEGKMNYIKLFHLPSEMMTQSSSLVYPLNQLYISMENKDQKATVDCDLRPI